jgi:hypothetical protein
MVRIVGQCIRLGKTKIALADIEDWPARVSSSAAVLIFSSSPDKTE